MELSPVKFASQFFLILRFLIGGKLHVKIDKLINLTAFRIVYLKHHSVN